MSRDVIVGGFAVVSRSYNIPVKYKEGETAYLSFRAREGKLEQVAIRSIKIFMTGGPPNITYYDNLNARYNEGELIDLEEAKQLAKNYYEYQLSRAWSDLFEPGKLPS